MPRLSFSTLGCPDWDIARIVSAAVGCGYSAIDFRGYMGTCDVTANGEFRGRALAEIAKRISGEGLAVSCLSSSARMSATTEGDREASLEAIRRYADLCHALGCRQVRIFGGKCGGIADPVANAAETLQRASQIAVDAGIDVLVETHDDWTSSPKLAEAVHRAGDPAGIGVVWDIHHTYRFHGERPADTVATLGGLLLNTHWKDSRQLRGGAFELCLCGNGDVPLADAYAALSAAGYDGWLTFEWEKKWRPELDDPAVAFPHFANFIRSLSAKAAKTKG